MNVGKTTQSEVLEAFRHRLIQKISVLNDQCCWLDDAPLPIEKPEPHLISASVCCLDGTYQMSGTCDLRESATIAITTIVDCQLDRSNELTVAFGSDDSSRILPLKLQILQAILTDRDRGPHFRWQPVKADGTSLLVGDIQPSHSGAATRHLEWNSVHCSLFFGVTWRWNI